MNFKTSATRISLFKWSVLDMFQVKYFLVDSQSAGRFFEEWLLPSPTFYSSSLPPPPPWWDWEHFLRVIKYGKNISFLNTHAHPDYSAISVICYDCNFVIVSGVHGAPLRGATEGPRCSRPHHGAGQVRSTGGDRGGGCEEALRRGEWPLRRLWQALRRVRVRVASSERADSTTDSSSRGDGRRRTTEDSWTCSWETNRRTTGKNPGFDVFIKWTKERYAFFNSGFETFQVFALLHTVIRMWMFFKRRRIFLLVQSYYENNICRVRMFLLSCPCQCKNTRKQIQLYKAVCVVCACDFETGFNEHILIPVLWIPGHFSRFLIISYVN